MKKKVGSSKSKSVKKYDIGGQPPPKQPPYDRRPSGPITGTWPYTTRPTSANKTPAGWPQPAPQSRNPIPGPIPPKTQAELDAIRRPMKKGGSVKMKMGGSIKKSSKKK